NSFREQMKKAVQESKEATAFNPKVWDAFAPSLYYIAADFTSPEGYQRLRAKLEEVEKKDGDPGNRLFYLATPPSFYADIVERLGANGLVTETGPDHDEWTRIIIEKPFGCDLDAAVSLNNAIHKVFKEEQIYRINHYLGKETVQNIL